MSDDSDSSEIIQESSNSEDSDAELKAEAEAELETELDPEESDENAEESEKKQDPRLKPLIRALLLASEKPLTAQIVVELIREAVDEEEWPHTVKESEVIAIFRQIQAELAPGVELVHVAQGWRYRTSPDLGFMVRRLWPDRIVRLSRAALEALSVVAYRQPCTRTDVEDVRGVDCSGVMRSLLERRLLKVVGHKDDVGHPLLYATTPEFLELFSLTSLADLPRLRDLEALHTEEEAREKGFRPNAKEAAQPTVTQGAAEVSTTPASVQPETPEFSFEDGES